MTQLQELHSKEALNGIHLHACLQAAKWRMCAKYDNGLGRSVQMTAEECYACSESLITSVVTLEMCEFSASSFARVHKK